MINEHEKQVQLRKIALQEYDKATRPLWSNFIKDHFKLTLDEIMDYKGIKPSNEDMVGNKSHEFMGQTYEN